ncbi:hypothetical protein L21SP3_01645 [Sedimentisphaera cyanobacteriorum]|uniref:DUF262 domain-containing protein n=1 Tax=Sedimentisphaera cyanobacteriorum TaxID=1940790 RepID=A0A1Q2HRF1_9BACT|nr:DUF262 domain-containing protein [Sedimentisphaera cyanobacteriorum]AQQ09826.1 hypothetical protein L21SP3_01645 [Sedimentisphaera cyanobacteriorum]
MGYAVTGFQQEIMMANFGFGSRNETFTEMFGNGRGFYVPKFQRDYSWGEEQWDDFWQDLAELQASGEKGSQEPGESFHYMGYLVLEGSGGKNFRIIDGQQRITTINLMILSALKVLRGLSDQENSENEQREEQIRNRFIGEMDYVSLLTNRKLHLNANNDRFYEQTLVQLEDMPARRLSKSNDLLKKAFNWYYERIAESCKTSIDIANFISRLTEQLFFTTIYVRDEINAYSVFETLNARGVQLSPTDLVKNYFFSIVDNNAEYFDAVDRDWREIIEILQSEQIPDFLRIYWNSRRKLCRKSRLFKSLKKEIKSEKQVFDFLRDFRNNADIYRVFKNPEEGDLDPEQKMLLKELKLFRVKQPYPLLLRCFKMFKTSDFTKILKACSILSFRYNVICGLNPNEQEKEYNKICLELDHEKEAGFVIERLREIMPPDETFKSHFETKTLPKSRNKIARYILLELPKSRNKLDISFESSKYDIEHILPTNPQEENWQEFSSENLNIFSERIGNLCLLKKKENQHLGNKPYIYKLDVYKNSKFKTTQAIAEYYPQHWTPEAIDSRQKEMARLACEIWRF